METGFRYTFRCAYTGTAVWVPKYDLCIESDGRVWKEANQPWMTADEYSEEVEALRFQGLRNEDSEAEIEEEIKRQLVEPNVTPVALDSSLVQAAVKQLEARLKAEQLNEEARKLINIEMEKTLTELAKCKLFA